jgi:hypothetical protein
MRRQIDESNPGGSGAAIPGGHVSFGTVNTPLAQLNSLYAAGCALVATLGSS